MARGTEKDGGLGILSLLPAAMLAAALIGALSVRPAHAVPVGYTLTQIDAENGTAAVSGAIDTSPVGGPGVLNFVGILPPAIVNQKDATAAFVPPDAVGFVTGSHDGLTGAPIGVYAGHSGTATLFADDGVNQYAIDVPLIQAMDMDFRYRVAVSDGPGFGNDVTSAQAPGGNTLFAGWIGDDGGGHRHTGPDLTFAAGQDRFIARVATDVDAEGWGDDIGLNAGFRNPYTGTIYVDTIQLAAELDATDATLRLVGPAPDPAPSIISSIVRSGGTDPIEPLIVRGLFEDVDAYVDRTHEYNNIPGFLLGADFVQIANDDKTAPNFQLDVTTSQFADLYLLVDNRVGDGNTNTAPVIGGGVMDWLITDGWVQTEFEMMVDEAGDGVGPVAGFNQFATLFVREGVPAGTISLFAQDDGGSRNMFGFAAVAAQDIPEPATATLGLLAIGAMAIRVRRRRA